MSGDTRQQALETVSGWKKAWHVFVLAVERYLETDGEQRAASFAYYALFALFPLMILSVSISSIFVKKAEAANAILGFVNEHFLVEPGEQQDVIVQTINGVVHSRRSAGFLSFIAITWSSLGFFHALVRGVNRSWGTHEYAWWRLPLKNLGMLGIFGSVLLIGIVIPIAMTPIENYWLSRQLAHDFGPGRFLVKTVRPLLTTLVLLYGLTMFYKFAPRRKTLLSEVWLAALVVTMSLQILKVVFVSYVKNFAHFNAIYGAFGAVVVLLLWIYLIGSLIVFGGCLSYAQHKLRAKTDTRPAT
jgi:YihY family inner membrane protein